MDDVLVHHGVMGQKWGVRRYQNEDGSLTALGKQHVAQVSASNKRSNGTKKRIEPAQKQQAANYGGSSSSRESSVETEEKDAATELEAVEQELIKIFGGESQSLKYVKTNRNKDDLSKTTFSVISPLDGKQSVYTLSTARGMLSYLKEEIKKADEAKKRTEAAKKQDRAKKNQEGDPKKRTNKSPEASLASKHRTQAKTSKPLSHLEGGETLDDVLVHYGVLGMKWGIRRYQNEDGTLTEAGKARVSKKYSSATNKLRRLDRKLEKSNVKKNKLAEKKFKAEYDAQKPPGLLTSNKTIAKRDRKAYKANTKYRKQEWKSEKTYNKASKWVKKMEKKFANVDLSSVNQSDIDFAKKYTEMVFEDTRRSSHSSIYKR